MPTGAELFAAALRRLGVTHIFTLVGDHLNEALQALDREGMEIIDTRHEAAAVHMADGYARMTRRLGVSLVTGAPGHTNSISGLAAAQATGVPVLAVSGASDSRLRGRNAFQDMNQLPLVEGVAKYAGEPAYAAQIPHFVRHAARMALSGRPGVAHLSIPVNVFTESVDDPLRLPSGPVQIRRPGPEMRTVERALALLARAERPVAIAGGGAWWADAGPELRTFIEAAQVPLFTITLSRGLVSDDHPLCFGYADPTLNPAAEAALRQADLVLLFGKRLDYRLRLGNLFAENARLVQVDIEPTEFGLNRRIDAAIYSDVKLALEALNETLANLPRPHRPDWLATLEKAQSDWQAEMEEIANQPSEPLHALQFFRELKTRLPDDVTLCWDGGDFVHWGRALLPARRPGRWLRLGALAGLGLGLPIGLTGQLLRPRERSVVITGDGSLGFYIAELDTAVRFNLPLIVIVGNDGGWGIERELQRGRYGERTVACELRHTRYDLVMEGFGGEGAHVTRLEDLGPALDRAFASDKPFLLNVEVKGAGSPFTQYQLKKKT